MVGANRQAVRQKSLGKSQTTWDSLSQVGYGGYGMSFEETAQYDIDIE